MKMNPSALAVRYRIGLEGHLRQGPQATYESARLLGSQIIAAGLPALHLAKLHEHILVTLILPRCKASRRRGVIKRAGAFLGVALTQSRGDDPDSQWAGRILEKAVKALSQRTVELAASNRELELEIVRRKASEAALKESQMQQAESMKRSRVLQEQMRSLSRQLLSAHEDERRRISRELHDVVAQTLTAINLRLSTFAIETAGASRSLQRNILKTQRMVEHSVNIVHQFARELRPTVLDDLGLIPALHSFLKSFTVRTGIHARLTAFAAVEKLDIGRRTALFRVAQEALTNVARHSQANLVEVTIRLIPKFVTMQIKDDGKSFDAETTLQRPGRKRLGLLGMRERIEMVGGTFGVETAPGKGVTITAQLSLRKNLVAR
jgi:signal transduction histidine kinase